MKRDPHTTGFLRTVCLLTTAALALNLFAAANLDGFSVTEAFARYIAQTPDTDITTEQTDIIAGQTQEPATTAEIAPELTGTEETLTKPTPAPISAEAPSEPAASAKTGPCGTIRENEQITSAQLTTVSDNCITATVTEGTIAFDYIPNSFSFPLKYTSGYPQDSFSNDNPATMNVDVTTGPEDIITLHDFRNNGGFRVTATVSAFESADGVFPLRDLYVATSYPDSDDFSLLDPSLTGPETGGVEYADGSNGAKDITSSTFTDADLNLPETYTVSFDQNGDDVADIIELMNTDTGHVGRFSQALSFLLKIPANQPAGTYQVKFTIDLII
jgi:hypothetical protein